MVDEWNGRGMELWWNGLMVEWIDGGMVGAERGASCQLALFSLIQASVVVGRYRRSWQLRPRLGTSCATQLLARRVGCRRMAEAWI